MMEFGSKPIQTSTTISNDHVTAYVDVMPSKASSFCKRGSTATLFAEDGSEMVSIKIGPKACRALDAGTPLAVLEVTKDGPQRVSFPVLAETYVQEMQP